MTTQTIESLAPTRPVVDLDAVVWAGGSYVRRPFSVPFRAGA